MPITSTCASSRRPIESARSSLQSSKHSCQFQSCAPACLLQTFQEGKNGFRRSHSSSNVFQFQDWRKSCYIMLLHQIAACHASTSSASVRVQNFYLRAACTFCMAYMAPVYIHSYTDVQILSGRIVCRLRVLRPGRRSASRPGKAGTSAACETMHSRLLEKPVIVFRSPRLRGPFIQ